MKTVRFWAVVALSFSVCVGQARAKETSSPGGSASLDSIAKAKESRRARDIEFLHTLFNKIKEREYVSMQDSSSIDQAIGRLIEDQILGLTVSGRRELVRKTLGEEDYSMLERTFLRQLGSPDGAQQKSALRSLGYPLFVADAADRIKAFVFHADRMTQYLAIRSLVYLDVAGANGLLMDMIRSGALMDYQLSQAIHALYVSNDEGLDGLATALLEADLGGMTFKSLLPLLKKRPDYGQVVRQLFKSNVFSVPDKEGLPLEQQSKALAEHDLLEEILSDPGSFMTDEAIKKKILMYASTNHNGLYTLALLILEKSGQDIGFFKEMLRDTQLPAQKKRVLELIVSRIENGQRLK